MLPIIFSSISLGILLLATNHFYIKTRGKQPTNEKEKSQQKTTLYSLAAVQIGIVLTLFAVVIPMAYRLIM